MPEDLVFMMGNFEARIPTDRMYSDNHLWLQQDGNGFRVGFTAYSVRLLQDVYFLDWTIDAGVQVAHKQEIGEIESSKALSTLYAPFEGRVANFNENLLDDPSAINTGNYADGWLYQFETDGELMTPQAYHELLDEGWEETQRLLKGQIN